MNTIEQDVVRVLLADDSALIRQRMSALLREEPRIQVVGEAEGADDALLMFDERQPDAVVLDIQMADGSGFMVLQRIKKSAPWCVVIILTSFQAREYRQECHGAGADFFFHKATEFESVVSVLGRLSPTNRHHLSGAAAHHQSSCSFEPEQAQQH